MEREPQLSLESVEYECGKIRATSWCRGFVGSLYYLSLFLINIGESLP